MIAKSTGYWLSWPRVAEVGIEVECIMRMAIGERIAGMVKERLAIEDDHPCKPG